MLTFLILVREVFWVPVDMIFKVQIRPTFNQSAWPIAVNVQPVQLQLCMWEMSP